MLKGFGRILITMYFLVTFTWMLCDYRYWENELLYLFGQLSIGIFNLSGFIIPMTGKYVAIHSAQVIQTVASLAILLLFSGLYGCKKSLLCLAFSLYFITILHEIPITKTKIRDPNAYVLNFIKQIATNSSLLLLALI